MIRVLSNKKDFIKWGPRLLIGALFGAFAFLVFGILLGLAGLALILVFACICAIAVAAAMIIAGLSSPPWLFEFNESGVRYHKFPHALYPWPDVKKIFYSGSSKHEATVYLHISSLPFRKELVLFDFAASPLDPSFNTFDEFRTALENLYGEKILDATKQLGFSHSEWAVVIGLVHFPMVALIFDAFYDMEILFYITTMLTVSAIGALHMRSRKRKLAKLLR